jgi:hypothetical protein
MVAAGLMGELNEAQVTSVTAGRLVAIHEQINDKPWPRARIYARVRATPEEVAAVFFDYQEAKSYVPDVLESRISKRVCPRTVEVDYEVDVPILADEHYTALNEIKATGPNSYVISWRLLRALQTKGAVGSLRIEPYGKGDAVICYTNLVTPGSAMAKILRSMAMKRMEKTVEAIVAKVEDQKKRHPAALAKQVEALRVALAESP